MGESVAQLESRVARVEAGVEYISSRVSNIEIDLRDMRKSMDQKFDGVAAEFKAVRAEMGAEFKAVRAEMGAEFQAVRVEMSGEFKSVRREMTRLQLITVMMGVEVLLVTKGSQMFQILGAWLSHFR